LVNILIKLRIIMNKTDFKKAIEQLIQLYFDGYLPENIEFVAEQFILFFKGFSNFNTEKFKNNYEKQKVKYGFRND